MNVTKKQYCLCGLYNYGSEKVGLCYPKALYLCVEDKTRAYYFEDEPNEETLFFDSKKDAKSYLELHQNLKRSSCTSQGFIVVEVEPF